MAKLCRRDSKPLYRYGVYTLVITDWPKRWAQECLVKLWRTAGTIRRSQGQRGHLPS